MDAVRTFPALFLLLGAWLCSAPAQVPPAAKTPPVFSLLNLIRSPQPATLKIGSEPVGEGQMSFGFFTGVVTWLPSVPLLVEAPGFGALRIPFTPGVNGECPLLIVQDALEKPPGGGDPRPTLKYFLVPNAKDRPAYFTDGLNLTSQKTLVGRLDEKTLSLEQGKRTRLTNKNGFVFEIQNGPRVGLGGSEEAGGMLVIFYENLDGKIEFALTNDTLITP